MALEELDVLDSGFSFVPFGELEHLIGHVKAIGEPGRADPARGEQHVDAATAAEVQHGLARFERGEGGGIAAAERCVQRVGWDELGIIVRVQPAGDEVVPARAAAR